MFVQSLCFFSHTPTAFVCSYFFPFCPPLRSSLPPSLPPSSPRVPVSPALDRIALSTQ